MGYLHSRRVCLNLLAERCARVPVAVCMCWLYAGYSLGRGGSTLPAMWFSRLRIGTGSSAAARSARLRCISIGDVTCMMMRLGRTGYRAVPCARCYSEGDVQAAHTTPQAISRLQNRVFIRNRLRGANVAQSKVLRGGRRGRRSGEAEKRRSGEAEKRRIGGSEDRRLGDAGYAGYYFCVLAGGGS